MTAQEIKQLRQDLGIDQRELAEIVGVSQPAVAQWELGNRVPDRHAHAVLKKLRERADREGSQLAETLLTVAGTAGFVMVLDKLFGDS